MPKYQEAKQKHQEEEQHRLNATYNKYGIDPNNFSYDDFSKWAEEHNFNRIPHNDPLEAGYDWLPNEKGVSKEVKKDKETLEQLALNNRIICVNFGSRYIILLFPIFVKLLYLIKLVFVSLV